MAAEVWYTARETFDSTSVTAPGWDKYIKWSKITHLEELVSLDCMLNSLFFEPDYDSEKDWDFIVTAGQLIIPFFTSLDYVIEKTEDLDYFNLLAVIKEPTEKTKGLDLEFEFVGYDLIGQDACISALVNCGGFENAFRAKDLNKFGLISELSDAKTIQVDLERNNPNEDHAYCDLFEVWRHKKIGRR